MAFVPLEPTAEIKPSSGFVPLEEPAAPATSASAPIDSGGGAAFGMYPRPGMKPMREGETSTLGAFGASALESVAATPGALLGARTAMAVTPAVVPMLGPAAA